MQVLPLDPEQQAAIIEMRLTPGHPRLRAVKAALARHEYAEIVTNPLMLGLLCSLLADGGSGGDLGGYSRGELYVKAIHQLLHKSSSLKWGRQRDLEARFVEDKLRMLADPRCFEFLKVSHVTS